MAKKSNFLKDALQDSKIVDSRNQTDTIRLWESYRSQALFWRAIALLQIPATLAAILFAWAIWSESTIILNVPYKPLPGQYPINDIPDGSFIDYATNYINLIATYTPAVAERQFKEAEKYLADPALSLFRNEFLNEELKLIKTTSRSQIYLPDPSNISVTRHGQEVVITITGERQKYIAGKELPLLKGKYTVYMTTVPRNPLNEYGMTITNVTYEDIAEKGAAKPLSIGG